MCLKLASKFGPCNRLDILPEAHFFDVGGWGPSAGVCQDHKCPLPRRESRRRQVKSPCPENNSADTPPPRRAQVGAGVGKPRVDSECGVVNGTGNSPSPGQPTPGVVKQDKSSGGSVDTTKTRSDPQGVRMSSGERPMGTAKGKQTSTMASCQTPPPAGGHRAMARS